MICNVDAVLRNLHKRRVIITDRFYSSLLPSNILLLKSLYHIGTIQTNRVGVCKEILYE